MRNIRLILVLAVVYIDMLGVGLSYPILPKLVQHFQHGDVSTASYAVGLIASAFSLMQFFVAPLLGALSDRFGRRPVLLLSLAGSSVSYFVMAAAPSLTVLIAGRLFAGAMAGSSSTAGAYIADITPPERRSQSFGLIGAMFGFGFITGPVIGGLLGEVELHLPFLAAGILCVANLAFSWFALPESLAPENRRSFRVRQANPIGALREIGRYPSVYVLLAIFVMGVFGNRVSEMTWVLYTSYRFQWTPFDAGLSLAVVGLIFVVGQGWFVRVLIGWIGERPAILLGLLMSAVVCVGYGSVTKGWMMYVVMPFSVCAWTVAQPAVQGAMSRQVAANEQGLLQGAATSITALSSIFGPIIWTSLFGYFVSPAAPVIIPGAAFFVSAAVFVLALALAWQWEHSHPQPERVVPS
ncbi:MAG: TCR/Tet family MFS transporter [Alphaproteobacteria bacterium]|nr:TCR/Tet family MFS transporter [Alphaproteobacteria bacterium]MBL7099826.1 TCR/Tet family MFS transporter [Alphaproteobacteria bacterium]